MSFSRQHSEFFVRTHDEFEPFDECPDVLTRQVSVTVCAPRQDEPAAPAPVAAQRPACPAYPPGFWMPRQRPDACLPQTAAASAHAQVDVTQKPAHQIRLVRAARPPAPLSSRNGSPVTSLTINHLPFQMRRTQLCDLLDEMGFAGRYDYLYVPCNRDKTSQGHAFINMCTLGDAREFFAVCHGARVVGVGVDSPVLSVAVSTVQGFEASIQRWTVAKMLSLKDPDFRPFIAGMNF